MHSLRHEITRIVERASTIRERLAGNFLAAPHDDIVTARIATWRQLVAKGDQEQFAKHLLWNNLDIERVREVLGGVELKDKNDLPPWADLLTEALENAAEKDCKLSETDGFRRAANQSPDARKPLPFEKVFVPFIRAAGRRLRSRVDSIADLINEEAYLALERGLARTLSFHCAPAIYTPFSAFRTVRQSSFDRLLSELFGEPSTALYDEFISNLLSANLLPLFQEYPVLARIIATVSNNWVEAAGQFLDQLRADLPELERVFNGGKELGPVVEIEASLSDRHAGSKIVMGLRFEAGVRLVYKPKDLSAEVAFYDLLRWLGEHGAPLNLRPHKVLSRRTHGWTEFIEHRLCKDDRELGRYYARIGALLCLLYVLYGTDAHCENVIADGEYPALVDMETLMHPQAPYEMEQPPDIAIRPISRHQMIGTVLRTGILPNWEFGPDGQLYDSSALWNVNNQETVVSVPRFKHPNTDVMTMSWEPVAVHAEAHLPRPASTEFSLSAIADRVVDGFGKTYRFVMDQKAALLAPGGPLAAFSRVESRFLRRMTRFYMHHLFQCLQAHHLRDGADFSIQLDVLSREMISAVERPAFWPLLRIEAESLLQLDIPFFLSSAESGRVSAPGHITDEQYHTESGFDLVVTRLAELSEPDLEKQQGLIRASLFFRGPHIARIIDCKGKESDADALDQRARNVAYEIARRLLERGVKLADGGTIWLGPESRYGGERHLFLPMGYGLYEGSAGVALFLSAVAKITGDPEVRREALSALRPLRSRLRSRDSALQLADAIGIGGLAGCGSIIYSLVHCGRLLDEPGLFEDAAEVAELISPARIAADRNYDLFSGAAGALLGLLSVYGVSREPVRLERAIECGRHLMNGREANNGGPRAWRTGQAIMMTGFSHGAAGIAYALLRLYNEVGETEFQTAAAEAVEYEAGQYSPGAGNWPDLRPEAAKDGAPKFMTSWCSGAPGIALARLAGLRMLDGETIRRDIDNAISTTVGFGVGKLDHLCCGNFGRIAVLRTAASLLSRPELRSEAERQSERIVERVEQTGLFGLSTTLPNDVFVPGFFQGLSGIGYELLRLAQPQDLPSVLLLE